MTPDEATLHLLYIEQGKSLAEIGRLYGVHKNQVRRWLLRAAIPTRSVSEGTKLSGKYGVQSEAHRDVLRKNAAIARQYITEESRKKQSESMKGKTPYNKGKTWTPEERATQMTVRATDEYKRNLSASLSGEKNHMWRGGVTPESTKQLQGWRWRQTRHEIYERDNWTCADCGQRCLNTRDSKSKPKLKIQCHHIIPRRLGGADAPENLITLCMSCHHVRERQIKE